MFCPNYKKTAATAKRKHNNVILKLFFKNTVLRTVTVAGFTFDFCDGFND